jgi:hypothetical protein
MIVEMEAEPFDEDGFFRAIAESGARALLIGRRALLALGIPVMTADYGFWIDGNDAARFNACLAPFGFVANRTPEEARGFGRYVLENQERIDVLIARQAATVGGAPVTFDDLWSRRRAVDLAPGLQVFVPTIADLIATKRFAARAKDLEDIRLLEALLAEEAA